jgi:5-methylcytosine-specific restriction endonuclease McrA
MKTTKKSINELINRCLSIHRRKESHIRNIGNGLRKNIYIRCGIKYDLSIDHIVPVSKGGVKAKFNLQTLCRNCNRWKGHKIIDFRRTL